VGQYVYFNVHGEKDGVNMRITESAKYLGISINTLKAMADSGKIKSYKTTGGHRRFNRNVLDEFMGIQPKHNKEKKYEEELAEDIMKILTCYSARYYGARGGRKKGKKKPKTVEEVAVLQEIPKTAGELEFD